MDKSIDKFAYRCLPLVMANQHGWDIVLDCFVRATWDGTQRIQGLRVETVGGSGSIVCSSHFGEGILTFSIPYVFRTTEGWNLYVKGPANSPKDGIAPLEGVIETDWAHETFTVNWLFTRPCTVEFGFGESVAQMFPVERGTLEKFKCDIQSIKENEELREANWKWQEKRGDFLSRLQMNEPQAVKEKWQKDYMRGARETKCRAQEWNVCL